MLWLRVAGSSGDPPAQTLPSRASYSAQDSFYLSFEYLEKDTPEDSLTSLGLAQ